MNVEDEKYLYWLNNIQGIGKKKVTKLLYVKKTAKGIYEASPSFIEQLDFLTTNDKKAIIEGRTSDNLEKEYKKLREKKIRFLYPSHNQYPKRLKDIPDSPNVLYVMGELPDDPVPSVAVIGARQCSEYGRYVAKELGRRLALEGIQVVSGLARGIDSEAQKAALEAGGRVFGVLGCGVDVCYPKESRRIYEKMKSCGGLISEYPPGTEPKANFFPLRNRIISGLADAIVVVEAKEKSGTLITVDMALEQGKEVYVIPGRVTDPLSVGCNRLIKQGAGVLNDLTEFVCDIKQIAVSRKEIDDKYQKEKNMLPQPDKTEGDMENMKMHKQMLILKEKGNSFYEMGTEVINILYLEPKNIQQIYSQLIAKYEITLSELAELLYEMENVYILHKKDGFYVLKT